MFKFYAVITGFLLLNILLLYRINIRNKQLHICRAEKDDLIFQQELLEIVQISWNKSYKINPSEFIHNLTLKDTELRSDSFTKIAGQQKLVFWIPQFACDVCYSKQLALLTSYFAKNPEDLIIITSLDKETWKYQFSKGVFADRFYFVAEEVPNIPDDQLVCYFLYHHGKISDLYFPVREFDKTSHFYLKMISEKLKKP